MSIIRLLNVDYCPRLCRAFKAIMLRVNADTQRVSACDQTAFDEQLIAQSIFRTYTALRTSFVRAQFKYSCAAFFAILRKSTKRLDILCKICMWPNGYFTSAATAIVLIGYSEENLMIHTRVPSLPYLPVPFFPSPCLPLPLPLPLPPLEVGSLKSS